MSVLFSNIIKQALLTFDQKNINSFTNNFKILKQLVNELTINDLNLNTQLLNNDVFKQPGKAPCTYVHILQTKDVSMSVFILRNNYTMPLHDHPMMYGILKCLSGTLNIQSYSRHEGDQLYHSNSGNSTKESIKEIDVICEPPITVNNSSECVILTPEERNFHEIKAINDVGAFFDILAPPYDSNIPVYGRRKCSFFRRKDINEENSMKCKLIKIPSPISYYCDNGEYKPPKFLYEIIYQHLNETSSESSN